jgi:Fe-S oxidoreductase
LSRALTAVPVLESILEAIGNTPLLRLGLAGLPSGAEVWGKCEWFNPGGSVKDRTALSLVTEGEKSGALRPAKRLDYRVTYHDPCTLGRYNGVYDEPRSVLAALGVELREMPRSRDNSFCCGAGGGRIWMKELAKEGSRRPSEQRIDEAVGLGELDYFVVACPKDVTMYEDAIKTSGHQGEIELRELSELVLEALELPPLTLATAESEEVAGA